MYVCIVFITSNMDKSDLTTPYMYQAYSSLGGDGCIQHSAVQEVIRCMYRFSSLSCTEASQGRTYIIYVCTSVSSWRAQDKTHTHNTHTRERAKYTGILLTAAGASYDIYDTDSSMLRGATAVQDVSSVCRKSQKKKRKTSHILVTHFSRKCDTPTQTFEWLLWTQEARSLHQTLTFERKTHHSTLN